MLIAWWLLCFILLFALAAWLGYALNRESPGLGGIFRIFIDQRGRYSLSQFQAVAWTLVIVSLIAGVVFARLFSGNLDGLGFAIPNELFVLLGISLGSTALSLAVKAGKDNSHPEQIAASDASDRPRFRQIFLVEEGEFADRIIDVTKYQNFGITIVLVVAYVWQTVNAINRVPAVLDFAVPALGETFLTLLGVSHAAYLAGKLPARSGSPPGLTLALKRQGAVAAAIHVATPSRITYIPRNPG
jgi:hypothetical protein